MKRKARLIAFYLPQFHPIPENDEWWGKGFTEWTNTAKAKPLFRGHYQPHIPADLGFYDLRVPETRIAQADMARDHGIEAFCYYHYWFGGKRILDRPLSEVFSSGEPNFPFCLCWANETWTGIWHGAANRILIKQTYPGLEDHKAHFNTLLEYFCDSRYITLDSKPIFLIYHPFDIPDYLRVTELWRDMALKSGLKGLHLVGMNVPSEWIPRQHGYDALLNAYLPPGNPRLKVSKSTPLRWLDVQVKWLYWKIIRIPSVYSYEKILPDLLNRRNPYALEYPCLIPNWDNTPRSGCNGLVLHGSTPSLFRLHLKQGLKMMEDLPFEHKLIFIKSWNEWAEGNHLEPDMRYGRGYLDVIRNEVVGI